jgi:outer membrane protein OmpA-like peptidoglycan-associated protein
MALLTMGWLLATGHSGVAAGQQIKEEIIKLNTKRIERNALSVAIASLVVLLLCAVAGAQSSSINGVINSRNGPSMGVQTQNSGTVTVLLTDATQVEEPEGVFRKKHYSMVALVPGLQVNVRGTYNAENQLVADAVKFKGSDLKTAQDIQAGLAPTEQQVQRNEQQNEQQIAAQQQQIQQQEQQIHVEEQKTAAHQAEIAANRAAIVAANKRFGELGDYNVLGEVTVLFGNDKVVIADEYKPQLLELAQKAKGVTAYVILVKGYASKVGSAALNQRLSSERAENVTNWLEQQGKIPLTNILAPGAMGTSRQVAPDTTAEDQAENRRVVVRILQNKGIAGT